MPAQTDGASDGSPKPGIASGQGSASDEVTSSSNITSPRVSRSASPATGSSMGSRAASPVSFGYPYGTMQNWLFDSQAPTAIRG